MSDGYSSAIGALWKQHHGVTYVELEQKHLSHLEYVSPEWVMRFWGEHLRCDVASVVLWMIEPELSSRKTMDHPLVGRRVCIEGNGEFKIDEEITDGESLAIEVQSVAPQASGKRKRNSPERNVGPPTGPAKRAPQKLIRILLAPISCVGGARSDLVQPRMWQYTHSMRDEIGMQVGEPLRKMH